MSKSKDKMITQIAITLGSGGTLTLLVNVDIATCSEKDRLFIADLVDTMYRYGKGERPTKDKEEKE